VRVEREVGHLGFPSDMGLMRDQCNSTQIKGRKQQQRMEGLKR